MLIRDRKYVSTKRMTHNNSKYSRNEVVLPEVYLKNMTTNQVTPQPTPNTPKIIDGNSFLNQV